MELPKLKSEERQEVLEWFWDLAEQDLVRGVSPAADDPVIWEHA